MPYNDCDHLESPQTIDIKKKNVQPPVQHNGISMVFRPPRRKMSPYHFIGIIGPDIGRNMGRRRLFLGCNEVVFGSAKQPGFRGFQDPSKMGGRA
jgi:hypothetical protein